MLISTTLLTGFGLLGTALAAFGNNPSGNYTPAVVECPANRPHARVASTLSTNETSWLTKRRKNTLEPLIAFLEAGHISGFNATSYVRGAEQKNVPNVGIAVSGGGYRALMNGAGFLAAADSRTPDQPANGSISGLLQSATYLAGLSGGGWLVGSIFANNFSSTVELRDGYTGSDLWRFDNSIFKGPSDDAQDNGENTTSTKRGIIDTAEYWYDVADQVQTKDDAGFDTAITDYWGRALSYQLINAPDGGLTYTFSSIALSDHFINAETPFPILVADSRAPGTTVVALNCTVYEFNAFEMGTWDPSTFGFIPTEYIGSNFTNGRVAEGNDSHCVRGFDQYGFVMGTSSTLFNQFLLANLTEETGLPSFVTDAIDAVLKKIGNDNNDIAQYVPNPFLHYNPSTNPFANNSQLTLVDGGEDLQNIPLHPLIQPIREVDIIVAVDSSCDTDYCWPNGTALRASYERSLGEIGNGTLFPPVPDDHTFVNLGLNQHPTFFGCDASNFTLSGSQTVPPLIVYMPNAPYTEHSNVTTFTPSYTLTKRNDIIQNGFNLGTQANGTINSDWPTCLSCAILSRSFHRTNYTVPAECTACFTKYCWNGTISNVDNGEYNPAYIVANVSAQDNGAGHLVSGNMLPRTLAFATVASVLVTLFM